MQEILPVKVIGHLHIEDDLGTVLVDKHNAIHPQNMARVITRALANESNYFVKQIAFGNGGTDINAALALTAERMASSSQFRLFSMSNNAAPFICK